MRQLASRRLPWSLFALSVLVAVAALILSTIAYPKPHGDTAHQLWASLAVGGILIPWGIIGALVASRRPENPIGWMFVLAALGMSLAAAAGAYAEYAVVVSDLPGAAWIAWLTTWLFTVSAIVAPVVLFLIFPTGSFLSPLWRRVTILILLMAVGTFTAEALRPGSIDGYPTIENPLGTESEFRHALDWFGDHLLGPFVMLFVIASLVVRLRRSTGVEREQIKWVASAAAVACLGFLVAFVSPLSFAFVVALVALAAVPVAAGLAILRYRLYEIDRIVNRTVVYGAVSALLAGLYFAIVLALQEVFSGFAGGSDLAIAASTLAVAALFRPARRRIQALVDRRFYRHRYDTQQTLEAFSAHLRDEVDLDSLAAELRTVVIETMQPAHVSLWLRQPEAEQ